LYSIYQNTTYINEMKKVVLSYGCTPVLLDECMGVTEKYRPANTVPANPDDEEKIGTASDSADVAVNMTVLGFIVSAAMWLMA
jgi:hypothetical protein